MPHRARSGTSCPGILCGDQPTYHRCRHGCAEHYLADPGPVSFLVSFAYVRHRSVRTTENEQPRSRTLLTSGGLRSTDLESVLGQSEAD